jgi:hypothetical protein
MARDNSPKERQRKQLERKLGRRASYDRILIVSEGSKTEPNYFREIRSAYRLHTANVEVQPSGLGTAPYPGCAICAGIVRKWRSSQKYSMTSI